MMYPARTEVNGEAAFDSTPRPPLKFSGIPLLTAVAFRAQAGYLVLVRVERNCFQPVRWGRGVTWSLVLCFFLAGCASRPFFPLGLYGVGQEDLSIAKDAGFNTVVAHPTDTFLDYAQRNDVKVLARSGSRSGSRINWDRPAKRARSFDRHPALWGWYIFDEPDLHGVDPNVIRKLERSVKRTAARKNTLLVLSSAWAMRDYGHLADFILVDHYPVPWGPLAQFGRELRIAKMAAGNRPVGAIMQAFNWAAFPEMMHSRADFRSPSFQELRCMAFMAAAEKVDALFFYSFKAGSWDLQQDQPLWKAVQQVVSQVTRYLPLFQGEHLWFRMQDDYGPAEGAQWNSIAEEKITKRLIRVGHPNGQMTPGAYLLLINTTDAPVHYKFRLSDLTDQVVGFAEGGLVIDVDPEGWADSQFDPYEVILLGPVHLN